MSALDLQAYRKISAAEYGQIRSASWTLNADLWSGKLRADFFRKAVFSAMLAELWRCAHETARPFKAVADVGCGDGAFSRLAAAKLPRLNFFGVDQCDKFDRERSGKVNFEFIHADLECSGWAIPQGMDAAIAILSLIEMANIESAIKNIRDMLRPNGSLIFVVLDPNLELRRYQQYKIGDTQSELINVENECVISSYFEVEKQRSVAPYYRFVRPLRRYLEIIKSSGLELERIDRIQPNAAGERLGAGGVVVSARRTVGK